MRIHMRPSDLELLKNRGLEVQGNEVDVDVTDDEEDNGFQTISFNAGECRLQVYLDVRYERGGPYQFTSESKGRLGVSRWTT